jgi:hypothetical protein
MRNRVFHQARIADMMFEGVMTGSGPTLSCQMNGSVALGVSGLRQFQLTAIGSRRPPPPDWWVVKYHGEGRIFLPDFDHAAIRELSDEFGLVVLADSKGDPSDRIRHHYFFTSPAWDALRRWVMHHPKCTRHTIRICRVGTSGRSLKPGHSRHGPNRFGRRGKAPHGPDQSAVLDRREDRHQDAETHPRRQR